MRGRTRSRYLTTDAVAELLCVRPKTVRRWIHLGHLPAVRLHRKWRIPEHEIERLLQGRTHGG